MQKVYKSLDKQVRNMILDTLGEKEIDLLTLQGRAGTADGYSVTDQGLTGLVDALVADLRQMVKPWIKDGLDITASYPINDQITISSGAGYANGAKYVLNRTTTTVVPFEDDISLYYINLWQGKIDVETSVPENKLNIGKVIIPYPGVTNKIQDDKDNDESVDNVNAYIVSAKDLFFDDSVLFDDNSKDVLKDAMGTITFNQIKGDLILTENIRVMNAANTLTIDSTSIKIFFEDSNNVSALFNQNGTFYYDEAGNEFARYTKNDARIGNIRIIPNAIQSVNYVQNVSGFRIQDNGNAEFNDIRLRGTLYSSYISENLYVNPGVTIFGDLLLDDDIWVKMDQKIGYDRDGGQDSYWTYNSGTEYLECWVDGSLRIEV